MDSEGTLKPTANAAIANNSSEGPLPDARPAPIDFFGILVMMQAIFVDEMPKAVWTQARNRVSNILAEGARKNKWYRDQAGQYSLSAAAMEASLL